MDIDAILTVFEYKDFQFSCGYLSEQIDKKPLFKLGKVPKDTFLTHTRIKATTRDVLRPV